MAMKWPSVCWYVVYTLFTHNCFSLKTLPVMWPLPPMRDFWPTDLLINSLPKIMTCQCQALHPSALHPFSDTQLIAVHASLCCSNLRLNTWPARVLSLGLNCFLDKPCIPALLIKLFVESLVMWSCCDIPEIFQIPWWWDMSKSVAIINNNNSNAINATIIIVQCDNKTYEHKVDLSQSNLSVNRYRPCSAFPFFVLVYCCL